MAKAEISWRRKTEEGEKLQVYARHERNAWKFFSRHKRFDTWEPMESPTLEDWLALLDGIERRVARRLIRPEAVTRCKSLIRERFPEADI